MCLGKSKKGFRIDEGEKNLAIPVSQIIYLSLAIFCYQPIWNEIAPKSDLRTTPQAIPLVRITGSWIWLHT